MDWKELGKTIAGKGAKVLGAALTGGPVAGVTTLLADLFTVDTDRPEVIAEAIKQDPEAALKLKQFEMQHKERLQEILLEREKVKLEEEKARLADVQDARQREINIKKSGGSNAPMYILAGVIVAGFFALIYVLMKYTIPDGSKDVAVMLFGSLSTSFGMVVAYFFGSSKGSQDKNAIMSKR